MFEVGRGVQQLFDVMRMDGFRQNARFFRPGYFKKEFFTFQYLLKIKLHGIDAAVQGVFGKFQSVEAIQKVAAQSVWRQIVNFIAFQGQKQLRKLIPVGVDGVFAVCLQLQRFDIGLIGRLVGWVNLRQRAFPDWLGC